MPTIVNHPLSLYTDKLRCGEPFSSLLYGDGEFQALLGERTGQPFTEYREVVTPQLIQEFWDSLRNPDPNVIRGTDGILINYNDYGGGDRASVVAIGSRIEQGLTAAGLGDMEFVDGTIWEESVRKGELGPFLRAVREKNPVIVGNQRLGRIDFLGDATHIFIPDAGACSFINQVEASLIDLGKRDVYLLCMGLSAIPLIMRLRRWHMAGTYIDLGSVLDVFVGLGSERGWRAALYQDKAVWDAVVAKNLEGISCS